MMSPEQKFRSDPKYALMVNHFEAMLHNAEFTPSEIREMVMLACIHHEMRFARFSTILFPDEVIKAIEQIRQWKGNDASLR